MIRQLIRNSLALWLTLWPMFAMAQSAESEAIFFTPPGFEKPGAVKNLPAGAVNSGAVRLEVRDKATGKLTPCRVNIVGVDGNYYQPASRFLSRFDMTAVWPQPNAWGNRPGKAPFRYIGHYFYYNSETEVRVPAGQTRVEVWKGFEYRPETATVEVLPGQTAAVSILLERSAAMTEHEYFGGDLHLHFPRTSDRDDAAIFDLMEAEDLWFGTLLGYNEPAGPYNGAMEKMDSPQLRSLGFESIRSRGNQTILSGQEYRSVHFGHLNIYGLPKVVFEGKNFNLDDGPAYGVVAGEAIAQGGFAIQAHGGYAKEIYADAALGTVSAVELLQFGIYRELGLAGWYDMLNSGYRFPCVGASDFPACRFMSDCRTYVQFERSENAVLAKPTFQQWFGQMSKGRSFVSTGPLLLLDIDGHKPGDIIEQKVPGQRYRVRLQARCEVTPITRIELIQSGKVAKTFEWSRDSGQGRWLDCQYSLEPQESCWIAFRAWSTTSTGLPDAEAHTNPVYIDIAGKRTYHQDALDRWIEKIDGQILLHTQRKFQDKANVLAYFQRARDTLLRIRSQRGLLSHEEPWRQGVSLSKSSGKSTDQEKPFDNSTLSQQELRDFLQPVPPKSPQEALRTFEIADGFQVELVAAEPLVVDPVAAAVDEEGQLYVCEMRDYPFKPFEGGEPLGTVRLLRDTNADGAFDEAHIFADKLLWAAGVVPWKGGVFVAAAPDIWYLKDTDGDYRADVKRRVFTGFGTENQQAMVNNLQFGLDQWIYGTTAGNGGTVSRIDNPSAMPVAIHGRDFRFNPDTEQLEAITGTVQFGNTFDDWGNRFTCSESQPVLHVVQPDHYLARNPFLVAPRGVLNIAPGPVPIFRISPIERWRLIRSSRRIAKNERSAASPGASHYVIDAAAGATVYRGGAYGSENLGQIFVGDGQNNLVHRRRLLAAGVTFRTERIDEKSEFLRSSDIWFRPVNFVNAPDGTLYCLDMYREVLESIHIPLDVARHLNFANGREHGRIYRLAPQGFRSPAAPRLRATPNSELVKHLESPHGWWRDTAQRLLAERQAIDVVTDLRQLVRTSEFPQARLHALWTLVNLRKLDHETLLFALRSPDARLRESAVRLSEPHVNENREIAATLVSLAGDRDVRVRYQVAFSLGELSDSVAAKTLADLARRDGADAWMRTAILSSSLRFAPQMLNELLGDRSTVPADMLRTLTEVVGTQLRDPEVRKFVDRLEAGQVATKQTIIEPLLVALGRGMKQAGRNLGGQLISPWVVSQQRLAISIVSDPALTIAHRLVAVELLGLLPSGSSRVALFSLINPEHADDLQIAAISACDADKSEEVTNRLVALWNVMTPNVRQVALDIMLAREARARAFLTAASRGEIVVSEIDSARRESLLQHRDATIRQLASQIFANTPVRSRQEVIGEYAAAMRLVGQIPAGKIVFEKNCAACHQVNGLGFPVGPSLSSTATGQPQALLNHILDPNQFVLPNYVQYRVLDKQGRVAAGMIASQTATSITLRKDRDQFTTILRSEIEAMSSTGKSLMPEELEKNISLQSMADLIVFLQASATKGSLDPLEVRDFGTLPGLVEPK